MKESEIRPKELFDEYLRLSTNDAVAYFDNVAGSPIVCPGCEMNNSQKAFEKSGFNYEVCNNCHSLYLSPRPAVTHFEKFYSESPSSQFWATQFFPSVAESRREQIFVPRVHRINDYCRTHSIAPQVVIDAGAGYGVFLQEWKKLHPQADVYAIEPSPELAASCREKDIPVLQTFVEQAKEWRNKADLLTCFEVIEHCHDPLEFVSGLFDLVKPGGMTLVTGLGVEGFDIQVLWEESKSVSPPHHINFFSVKGFELLFQRAGFVDVQVMTPGKLDVDIVSNMLRADDNSSWSRFMRLLLKRGEAACKAFQEFLATHQMSSHCWIWARKPT